MTLVGLASRFTLLVSVVAACMGGGAMAGMASSTAAATAAAEHIQAYLSECHKMCLLSPS